MAEQKATPLTDEARRQFMVAQNKGYEELNRWLHENVMRLCWHERRPQAGREHNLHWSPRCIKCGKDEPMRADYCTSLDAVSRIENNVIYAYGHVKYLKALQAQFEEPNTSLLVVADPYQRAKACKEVWDATN